MRKIEVFPGNWIELPDSGAIGVSVSGGADSALLLHYLLKHHTDTVHVFTIFNDYKQGTNALHSVKVVGYLSRLHAHRQVHHHIDYVDLQDRVNLWQSSDSYLQQGITQYHYSGVTANPPAPIADSFGLPDSTDPERDPTVRRSEVYGNFYTPWTNSDKQRIAQMYQQEGLMDTLFPLTRSCEWSAVMSEDIPDPQGGHCGQCWWCQERFWGFGRL